MLERESGYVISWFPEKHWGFVSSSVLWRERVSACQPAFQRRRGEHSNRFAGGIHARRK